MNMKAAPFLHFS